VRYLAILLIVIFPLQLAARTEPPQIEQPEDTPARNFTIRGSNLTITPGETMSRLSFSGGVNCTTAEMELHADVLKLELRTAEVTGGTKYEGPKSAVEAQRLVDSPGETVRAMAAEMEIPRARFDESAIRQVVAQGNVRISSAAFSLQTSELASTDGGESWYTSGRSTISHCDETGACYELSSDYILYDMPNERALARGAISGSYRSGPDAEPVQISAERVELDIANSLINASEYLEVAYGDYVLCCGALAADIPNDLVRATDSPQLRQPGTGLIASAGELSVDLATMVLEASGGIRVSDPGRAIEMTAGQLTAYLEATGIREHIRLEAIGNPHLQRGESSFDGEKIVVFEEQGKTIIEVDGPQRARLDLDQLDTGKKEGAPPAEEPPADSD
jgi:lipopolysaccharide export system protein LptA